MNERSVRAVLRVAGLVELLAFLAVVMPTSWMDEAHQRLGLGSLPQGAVVQYMIRTASFIYGLHGVQLWLLATDVGRYRPIVLFTAAAYMLCGAMFFIVAATAGMPWFWSVGEGVSCFVLGGVLLWLCGLKSPRPVRS